MPESTKNSEPSGGKAFHSAETLIDIQRLAAANPGINQERLARALAVQKNTDDDRNLNANPKELADLRYLWKAQAKLSAQDPDYQPGANQRSETPKFEPQDGNAFLDARQKLNAKAGKKPGKTWTPQTTEATGPRFPVKGVTGERQVNAFTSRADIMAEQLGKKAEIQDARELARADAKAAREQAKADAMAAEARKVEESRAQAEIRKQEADAKKMDSLITAIDSRKTDLNRVPDEQIVKLHYHMKDRGAFIPNFTRKQIEDRYQQIASRVAEQGIRGGTDSSITIEEEPEEKLNQVISNPDAIPQPQPLINLDKTYAVELRSDPSYSSASPLINLGSLPPVETLTPSSKPTRAEKAKAKWDAANQPDKRMASAEELNKIKSLEQRNPKTKNRLIALAGTTALVIIAGIAGIKEVIGRLERDYQANLPRLTKESGVKAAGATIDMSTGINVAPGVDAIVPPVNDLQVGTEAASEISPSVKYVAEPIGEEPENPAPVFASEDQKITDARGFWSLDYSKLVPNYREWDEPGPNGVNKKDLMAAHWRTIWDFEHDYATLQEGEVISYNDLNAQQKSVIERLTGSDSYQDYMTFARPEVIELMRQLSITRQS